MKLYDLKKRKSLLDSLDLRIVVVNGCMTFHDNLFNILFVCLEIFKRFEFNIEIIFSNEAKTYKIAVGQLKDSF